jgi:hypothetical protein
MISRSQMNRQFYNMGGEGIMQMAPQQMQDPQQMQAPQQMQSSLNKCNKRMQNNTDL